MTDTLPMPITAPFTPAQRSQIINLIRRAARTEIMPRFRRLSAHQVAEKTGAQDLVTEADKAAEEMIARGLQGMFPHALVVGEEYASEHPEILDRIKDAELCFTIDPVDGTWNYAKGLPLFGVMLSALRFGVPVFGLLYDPVVNDFILADSENPAVLQMPRGLRREVSTSDGGAIEDLVGFVPLSLIPAEKRGQMAAAMIRFARVNSLRCACHEARMIAQGHADFVLFSKLTAWDQPPGAIVMKQAGAHVAMLDGSEYRADVKTGYFLAASDAATWGRVRDLFDFLLDPASDAEA